MKTISIKAEHAYLVVYGCKDVENRTWNTDYRGPLLIHASGKSLMFPDLDALPEKLQHEFEQVNKENPNGYDRDLLSKYLLHFDYLCEDASTFLKIDTHAYKTNKDLRKAIKKQSGSLGMPLRSQAIIGQVDLVDVKKTSNSPFAGNGQFHWILKNPRYFSPPIQGVKGKLRLWNYELTQKVNAVEI